MSRKYSRGAPPLTRRQKQGYKALGRMIARNFAQSLLAGLFYPGAPPSRNEHRRRQKIVRRTGTFTHPRLRRPIRHHRYFYLEYPERIRLEDLRRLPMPAWCQNAKDAPGATISRNLTQDTGPP